MRARIILYLLIYTCFLASMVAGSELHAPLIKQGTIDLRHWDFNTGGSIKLTGQWIFYANKLLASDLKLKGLEHTDGLIEVPQAFNKYLLPSGKPMGGKAFATYKLNLLLPDRPTQLSLFLNMGGSAHRLYLLHSDGSIDEIGGRGTPGKLSQTSAPSLLPFYGDFSASGRITLLWEFSNFHHYHGGIRYVPILGSPAEVFDRTGHTLLYASFGAVFIVTIYSFVIFGFYRRETASFWLGLSGVIVLFIALIQNGLFLPLYEHLDGDKFIYFILQKIRLISTGLIPIVTIKFFSKLLLAANIDIHKNSLIRKIHSTIYLFSLLFIVLVTFLSNYRATQILDYFYPVLILSILWGVILMGWQWIRQRQLTILLSLFGYLILVGTALNDILFALLIVKTDLYFQYGYLFFIITQGFVLARAGAVSRLKNEEYQTTIEKQSKSLEQLNLNLEKKVEDRTIQLKKAEAISSSLLQNSPDRIIAIDENLEVFYCNKPEPDQEDPFGKPAKEVLEPSAMPLILDSLNNVLKRGLSDMIEVQIDHKLPKQWYEYRFAGIKGEDDVTKGVMVTITNVTKRKQAEEELKALQQELVQKAHKAGMGDIAADILHNVGNSLNSLKLSADLALSSVQNSQTLKGMIEANRIIKDTDDLKGFLKKDPKAVSLINYYLLLENEMGKDYKKVEQNLEDVVNFVSKISDTILSQRDYIGQESMEDNVDLGTMIEEALKMQTDLIIKNNITVRKLYDTQVYSRVQKSKLMYVLVNLIENAIDAMKSKPLEERLLQFSVETDQENNIIRVKDSGEGIVSDNLTKVFMHGYTTKPKGLGFGLHNCANYMSEMQARIFVESKGTGMGATFSLLFPRGEPEAI
ncbi:MAG: ATP-binding protein [Proteobacteria bacterium]|nr:ATP-binding protein [Pseudomonadota bacterium]